MKVFALSLLAANFAVGATFSFSNPANISIPGPNDIAIASPYPSVLTVNGISGPVSNVVVTLMGVSHTESDDLLAVVSSPSGQAIVLLDGPGDGSISNLTFAFSAAAINKLPDFGPLNSGTFAVGQNQYSDDLISPGPIGPYGIDLLSAANPDPNGIWSLWIVDFNPSLSPSSGNVAGGWSIAFSTPQSDVPEPSSFFVVGGSLSFVAWRRFKYRA